MLPARRLAPQLLVNNALWQTNALRGGGRAYQRGFWTAMNAVRQPSEVSEVFTFLICATCKTSRTQTHC